MRIQIATSELVVFEAEAGELTDEASAQDIVRTALERQGLEQWSSIEIEEFTYCSLRLAFAKPVKVFIPSVLARLIG